MRIVWAEDTESDRFLIETALGPGIDVVFAEDGQQTVDLVRKHRPALAVVDLKMPRGGGIAALRRIRADPDVAATRVAVFSSSHQPDEVDAARALGAVAYIQKPIGFGLFQAAVRAITALANVAVAAKAPMAIQVGASGASAAAPAPSPQHRVVFWESEGFLLELVTRFLEEGTRAGHGLIVLATKAHIEALRQRLGDDAALWLDAADVLAAITTDGRPDPQRFAATFQDALAKASHGDRRPVTCFGELVTLLQQRGQGPWAVAIEAVGQGAAQARPGSLSILCAYPLRLVAADPANFDQICSLHTQVHAPSERHRRWVAAAAPTVA